MKNDPAFPTNRKEYDVECCDCGGDKYVLYQEEGISKLDYFAARAMQSYITHEEAISKIWEEGSADNLAHDCYKIAEAMIKESEKRSKADE